MQSRTRQMAMGTAAVLILVACGGDSDSDGDGNGTDGGGMADGSGVLRVATVDPIDNWDPLTHANPTYSSLVFDTLTNLAEDGDTVEPGLAAEWEQTNEHVELRLRDDVTFHDGTPFNAEAVVTNLERWRDTPSSYQSFMANVSEITAVDEHTVRLELSAPAFGLLKNMAHSAGSMVSPAALADGSFTEVPVGAGPWAYSAEESVAGAEVVVEAYEDYYAADEVGPSRVEFLVIAEPEQRYNALLTGDVDVIYGDGALADRAEEDGFELTTYPKVHWEVMFVDKDGLFEDVRVRQAMCHAIDREAWLAAQFNGYGEIYDQRYQEGSVGFNPDAETFAYDVEAARALMAEAGDPEIAFTLPAPSEYRSISELFASQMAEIGVDVQVDVMPFGEYFSIFRSGDFPVIIFSDASKVGPYSLYTTRYQAGATNNPLDQEWEEIEALAEEALAAPDEQTANEVWDELPVIIQENAYDCGYVGIPGFWISDPESVQNVVPTPYQIDTFRYDEVQMVG